MFMVIEAVAKADAVAVALALATAPAAVHDARETESAEDWLAHSSAANASAVTLGMIIPVQLEASAIVRFSEHC